MGCHAPSSPSDGGASTGLTIAASWDTAADVDLHVIEPSGTEIYWDNAGPTASGGALDVDANEECKPSSGGSRETVRWTGTPPNGTYIVRLDYYLNCGVAQTNYTLAISDSKTTLPTVAGTFTGAGDVGALGSGVTVKQFNHVNGVFSALGRPALPSLVDAIFLASVRRRSS